jgi:hypothetical protein
MVRDASAIFVTFWYQVCKYGLYNLFIKAAIVARSTKS